MRRFRDRSIHNVIVTACSFVLVMCLFTQHHVSYAADTGDGSGDFNNNAVLQVLTDAVYARFTNMSSLFKDDIKRELSYCVHDVDAEWDAAFNFSKNTTFLANCIKNTSGQITTRMCSAAEIKFYTSSLYQSSHLKPNKNCNLSSWVSGCEPGWACSVGNDTKVDMKNKNDIPTRHLNCQPCCEGFFCPRGLTCMLPCPLGAYCPLAKLNKTSGVCDPYRYQLPPGDSNHSCGGADRWADFVSGPDLFCAAGYYCPTTVQKNPCSRGHFCRAGSTAQSHCGKLATCEPRSATQNITLYGLLFFAGITLVLVIIYNCSDQVLHTREEKQAKSREAAAKSARETAHARQKWKSATSLARISRTFTRKKSTRQQEKSASSDAGLPPRSADASQEKGKKKEPSQLTKMMQELEENPESHEGFNVKIGDKNLKKQAVNIKELHTRSQIFRYAYGQIEKEKAFQEQTKNMTFSGVISMASEMNLRSRPPIEVIFKDLTLTLQGKNKHLLRCVTGKLSPGRISAVMGPSGAGKTTFLTALTGRATGCTMSGSILINGKEETMQSYRKIIGFVPQDDVVHGNLTVEENLWFSARCRLPADMAKPDKVLVIERVIESLGLQTVRDSLVGTVEKRGISGGQRKRVNVGLEMVIEPSLLILDEPTSGLDSSSSVLLLRALRREALEGVNICMVLHQPSYTLFKMFDDLILLAKGGLTAYHGSVKKVEEYFSGLGINVPDRINPPDHFIDILEGIVKPNASSGVNYKDLPLRWMLHNGYPVPTDILDSSELTASSARENLALGGNPAAADGQSFIGDLWQDIIFNVEQWKHKITHNFGNSKDLSNRTTPGIFHQYRYFLGRVGKQRLREARIQAVDFLILLLAGICLGSIAKVHDATFGSKGYLYTVIAVSLLSKIGALRTFSSDKLHYWRESASGMSSLAYFLAKDSVDLFNTIVKPAVYLSMFYFFNNPRSAVLDNYIILICLVYCVTGIAYGLAIYFEPGPAQLWSVLVPVVLSLIANQKGEMISKIANFCYSKWALEAFLIANAKRYSGIWLITRCGLLKQKGYDLKDWYPCLAYLVATGIASRVVSYMCLVTFQKK